MCLDIIVLVVIMYLILGGYISSFCCQDNKEELGIVTTITSILFLDGVDYVLVTQTLVTYQVTCKGKVNRLNGFYILYFVPSSFKEQGIKYKYRSTPTKATNPCKKSMILKVLTITVTILASFHTIFDSCPQYSIATQANLPQGRPLPLLPVERMQPGFGNSCQVI